MPIRVVYVHDFDFELHPVVVAGLIAGAVALLLLLGLFLVRQVWPR
jgi:hypothetical protein